MPRRLVAAGIAAALLVAGAPASGSAQDAAAGSTVQAPGPADPELSDRHVVVLDPATSPAVARRALRAQGLRVLAVHDGAVPIAVVRPTPGAVRADERGGLRALARDRVIRAVEPDTRVRVHDVQSYPAWGLDRIDQRSLPLSKQYHHIGAGAGVTAYVLDTGIRAAHRDFGTRVRPGVTFVYDGRGTRDCYGHGTHVAGTIGGARYGVAKQVRIVPVRVLDCGGDGFLSDIVAGLNWVIAHHRAGQPAVANISLGGPRSGALDAAVRAAVADGITVVVSAGNEGWNACRNSPAREPLAITVGATDLDDHRAEFSSFGRCLDLFAPGVGVRSAWYTADRASAMLSGTSMAAPHVSGAAALVLGRFGRLTPAQVAERLLANATEGVVRNPSYSPNRLLWVWSGQGDGAPANDDFGRATVLAPDGVVTEATNAGATRQEGEPAHAGSSASNTVWFRTTFAADGPVVVSTDGSDFDTILAVYHGSGLAGLTSVAANDDRDDGDPLAEVVFDATGGEPYSIAVVGRRTTAGRIRLHAAPLANDSFADVYALDVGAGATVTGTNRTMTAESGEPAHAGSGPRASAWWTFTAPADGTVSLGTRGSTFDTVLGVYTGASVDALTEVASDDDGGFGNAAAATFPVTGGETYRVAIDGWNGSGAIRLWSRFEAA